jgi:hypothetical protein
VRQAAGQAAHAARRVLKRVGEAVLLLVILVLVGALGLAWRLDRGPVALPWVAQRLEAAAHERGIDVRVGRVALAWGGFRHGTAAPLRLYLDDARTVATDRAGQPLGRIGHAELTIALLPLLSGHIEPATLVVTGLRGELARQADGQFTLGLVPAHAQSLSEAVSRAQRAPPKAFGGAVPIWRRLRHLHVHDVDVAAFDATIGLPFSIRSADIDLDRDAERGLIGQAAIRLASAAQAVTLTLAATHANGAATSQARIELSPVNPAGIAALAPVLTPLRLLDATLTASARLGLDRDLTPTEAHLRVGVGPGTVQAGQGTAPLLGASLRLDGTPAGGDGAFSLRTAAAADKPVTTIAATLHAARAADAYRAQVAATVDQLSFADLPTLWPAGTGGPGSRRWITQNIPSGELAAGHIRLALHVPADFSDVTLDGIDAGIDGHDIEVHWLRPVPPLMHAEGHLSVSDPNVIDIAVAGALQAGGAHGGVAYRGSHLKITGINDPDQFLDIDTDLAGPLADLLTVLGNPRLKLLSKRPVPMHDPAGTFTAHVHVGHLPLRDDVSMDDLAISTMAQLTGVHLGGIAAGRDLSDGDLKLSADNNGLQVGGHADIAGFPADLRVSMDFRAGPPDEVTQDVQVSGTVSGDELARQGFDPGAMLRGGLAVQARMTTQRNQHSDIKVRADGTDAAMTVPGLGFEKPPGMATHGFLHATLQGDRLDSIDEVRVEGPDIDVLGRADVADGRPDILRIDRLHLGAGTDAHGTVRLPREQGGAYRVQLAGPSLDIGKAFQSAMHGGETPARQDKDQEKHQDTGRGTPFTIDARFDRVLLGKGHRIDGFAAQVENTGDMIRAAHAAGAVAGHGVAGEPFSIAIAPEAGGRRATARIPDTGDLLRALDVTDAIGGGRLALDGRFDDAVPSHPLDGTVTLEQFRLLDAPLVARILKGATLVGIIDLMRGPGVGFSRLVVPFRYADGRLDIREARVVSPSLGGTAHGTIAFAGRTLDLRGTVVPAYALNTLPGRIPLIGRLFSPEKSGGIFAATFKLTGSIDHPDVSVNPLSVVAPGMLRDLFKVF